MPKHTRTTKNESNKDSIGSFAEFYTSSEFKNNALLTTFELRGIMLSLARMQNIVFVSHQPSRFVFYTPNLSQPFLKLSLFMDRNENKTKMGTKLARAVLVIISLQIIKKIYSLIKNHFP